ncbi:hypothetical protein CONPUDRAFT_61709 [Coniophora puteana RWD-64-598 SS2]|uniref:SigF-like NTF2-like domain-containing protein n=1 Tax=Coniophora puteana (strain RWD-64-598) TaxID=741705 RepID=A0A5M3MFE1_CONPW|nr:uncharacterized protein CONPUDRAFT_61709 [Coniophora puteana RWD-64-598 SS2]EIW77979.1 hypothetical protein CONPUDRAFT_61709 [Coniophora puteana RWD-64-598 SS2]
MQDPKQEITGVITDLTSATSAPALERTINTYFTPDARFLHPLCQTTTRAGILGVYEWYRIMSPNTKAEVLSVVYDKELNVIILEIVQQFRIWFSIFPSAPARLNTRLTLREVKGLYYIAQQEDFYHATDMMALLMAPLVPIVRLILAFAGWVCGVNALLFT